MKLHVQTKATKISALRIWLLFLFLKYDYHVWSYQFLLRIGTKAHNALNRKHNVLYCLQPYYSEQTCVWNHGLGSNRPNNNVNVVEHYLVPL